MISFYCFISRHAQCGIILFSVCTVQDSVQVFATVITKMPGHHLHMTSVCNRWNVLMFALLLLQDEIFV